MWSSLFLFLKKGDLQDEATGEKEYTMLWKQNRNRNFYKELIQKAGAETELVYMKASKELLKKRLYKRNQVLNANSPFVITDEILEHHYHAFQEPWGEGEKVILQKGDIMQYSKEESKAIWNQNAEFWDCAMGDESNDFHREVVRPKVTELLNPDPTDYKMEIILHILQKKLSLFWLLIIVRKWWNWQKSAKNGMLITLSFV